MKQKKEAQQLGIVAGLQSLHFLMSPEVEQQVHWRENLLALLLGIQINLLILSSFMWKNQRIGNAAIDQLFLIYKRNAFLE